jgi:uncharacterized membrane protein (TIGR02234 family)
VIDRLTGKRTVLLLVLAAASVILVSGSQEWVSGSVDDAVLGASALHGRGSDVAPGALAAALVGLASAVAAATSGALVRVVAACAALLAAVLGATAVVLVLADPGGALGSLAAAGTGRNGTLAAQGRVGSWAWVALAAMLVMGVGGLGALVGGRRWRGLSGRYDAPVSRVRADASRQGSAGKPVSERESAWDQLSRGEDPTTEHPAEHPTTER